MSIRTILLVCIVSAVAASSNCCADTLEDIVRRQVVRVAVPDDTPPFGVSVGERLVGYDVSIARMIAIELGVRAQLVPVKSNERLPALLDRRVDLIVSSLGKNPERERQISFTQTYAPFFLAVFGTLRTEVRKAADLSGKAIAVTKGSIEDIELSKIAPPLGHRRF